MLSIIEKFFTLVGFKIGETGSCAGVAFIHLCLVKCVIPLGELVSRRIANSRQSLGYNRSNCAVLNECFTSIGLPIAGSNKDCIGCLAKLRAVKYRIQREHK